MNDGELVAFPTETVYGLGADATQRRGGGTGIAAKGRPAFNPLITHVRMRRRPLRWANFQREARKLAQAFWPGPLTIVVPPRALPGVAAGLGGAFQHRAAGSRSSGGAGIVAGG